MCIRDRTYIIESFNTELVIGFEQPLYQVTEVQGQVELCFVIEENNVLDILGAALLNTQDGSAVGIY